MVNDGRETMPPRWRGADGGGWWERVSGGGMMCTVNYVVTDGLET